MVLVLDLETRMIIKSYHSVQTLKLMLKIDLEINIENMLKGRKFKLLIMTLLRRLSFLIQLEKVPLLKLLKAQARALKTVPKEDQ
jgi:hypothetical protein